MFGELIMEDFLSKEEILCYSEMLQDGELTAAESLDVEGDSSGEF